MSENMTPDEARDLLGKADQLGAAAQAGASWPQIALLLGLGGVSSMAIIGMTLAANTNRLHVFVLMGFMQVWLAILTVVSLAFHRVTKAGFGRRWRRAILGWGLTWVVAIVGGSVWWQGEMWFAVVAAAALTVVTVVPAWNEARR